MRTLFISDLHLEPDRPHITQLFLNFLETYGKKADALYILGDLFEVWLGDDHHTPFNQTVIHALKKLSEAGTALYFMHGNRDFLIGKKFAALTSCKILSDPTLIDLYGKRTLLMHGDTLCTDDIKYLAARTQYRKSFYMRLFLALPLFLRKKIASYLRQVSAKHTEKSDETIMDVNQKAVMDQVLQHGVDLLIHGHTHKPSIQYFKLQEKTVSRIVLSDWEASGNALIYEKNQDFQLVNFS